MKKEYCHGWLTVWTSRPLFSRKGGQKHSLPYRVSFGDLSMVKRRRGLHEGALYVYPYGRDFVITDAFREDLFRLASKAFAEDRHNQQGKKILLIEHNALMVFILEGIIPIGCEKKSYKDKYGSAIIFRDISLEHDGRTIKFDIMIHTIQPVATKKASAEAEEQGYAYFKFDDKYANLVR